MRYCLQSVGAGQYVLQGTLSSDSDHVFIAAKRADSRIAALLDGLLRRASQPTEKCILQTGVLCPALLVSRCKRSRNPSQMVKHNLTRETTQPWQVRNDGGKEGAGIGNEGPQGRREF